MRHRMLAILVLLTAAPGVAAPAAGQQRPDDAARGSWVTVRRVPSSRSALEGELLAINADSVWILADRIRAVPSNAVMELRIRRHRLGPGHGVAWSIVGGLITGGALTAACASVADDCGSVFLSVGLAWLVVGAISATSLWETSVVIRGPIPSDDLRRYARFPQGLPPVLQDRTRVTPTDPVRMPVLPVRLFN